MKQFKKVFLSFVLIFCSVILCACGSTPPPKAQIDTGASVNTSGTYTSATKEELTPYFDSTDEENYVGNQEFTGLHTTVSMSAKFVVTNEFTQADFPYTDYLEDVAVDPANPTPKEIATAQAAAQAAYQEYLLMVDMFSGIEEYMNMYMNTFQKIEDGIVTSMASKSVETMIDFTTLEEEKITSYEYFKDDVAYLDDGFTKYYLPKEDANFDMVLGDLTFDPDETFGLFATGILENIGVVVTKATEGTTVKYKAVIEGATDQDPDTQLVFVLEDGKFAGLQIILPDFDFSAMMDPEFAEMFNAMGISIVADIEMNIVAFDKAIEFPSDLANKYTTLFDPSTMYPEE